MDGSSRQHVMAQQVKAEIKQASGIRRKKEYTSVMASRIAATSPNLYASNRRQQHINHSIASVTENPLSSSNGSTTVNAARPASDSTIKPLLGTTLHVLPLDDIEIDFTITYLDYVFPFLFPYYQPSLLEGGRSWLPSTLKQSKALYHTAMSLSIYFFTLSLKNVEPNRDDSYSRSIWTNLAGHVDTAIKVIQADIAQLYKPETSLTVFQKAHAFESIIHMLIFESVLGKSDDWNVHLTAAITLFAEIFESHGMNDRPDLGMIMRAMYRRSSPRTTTSNRRLWNADQGAFRFFAVAVLHSDILSCTALGTPPQLSKFHASILANWQEIDHPNDLLRTEEYVGYHSFILLVLSEIATLAAWKKDAQAAFLQYDEELVIRSTRISTFLTERIADLERAANASSRQSHLMFSLCAYYVRDARGETDHQIRSTRIWAHAAQIYLLIVAEGWQRDNPQIRESIIVIIRLLGELSSPAHFRMHAWPLCVAGCLASAEQEHEFRALSEALGTLKTFGAIGLALRIMERVWDMRDRLERDSWDLAQCLKILGSSALLC